MIVIASSSQSHITFFLLSRARNTIDRRNNYIFIKIPFITIDLTRDIDVISYHNRLEMKTTFFRVSFDYYSLERLRRQLNVCNLHKLNDTDILKPREFYYFDMKNGFKVEINKMTVLGFNEDIDYCLLVNNIIENGFVLYYGTWQLKVYIFCCLVISC